MKNTKRSEKTTIKEKYIPAIARPGISCMQGKFKQQPDGSWKASCDPESKRECYGCSGEAVLSFNPARIVNYKEIRANEEKDYEMGLFSITTTEEFDKRTLKEYAESPEQWYYFHDYICDEDRICVFQIAAG